MSFIDLSSQEIYKNIRVYKNLIPDCFDLYQSMRRIEQENEGKYLYKPWVKWYDFGTYSEPRISAEGNSIVFNEKFSEEFNLFRRLRDATSFALANYVTIYSIDMPDGAFVTNPSLARYKENKSEDELIMTHHTDFVIGEWYWPGDKFLVTCTTYLNDDYVGGEIQFYIEGEKITYKPSAGDILIFPSGSPIYPGNEPFFHGVKMVSSGDKYLVRNYLKYPFGGTEEWRDGEKRFGAEDWKEISLKKDRYQNTINFDIDGNPHMSDVAVEIYKKNSKWIAK
jgi:hypothetical protein